MDSEGEYEYQLYFKPTPPRLLIPEEELDDEETVDDVPTIIDKVEDDIVIEGNDNVLRGLIIRHVPVEVGFPFVEWSVVKTFPSTDIGLFDIVIYSPYPSVGWPTIVKFLHRCLDYSSGIVYMVNGLQILCSTQGWSIKYRQIGPKGILDQYGVKITRIMDKALPNCNYVFDQSNDYWLQLSNINCKVV